MGKYLRDVVLSCAQSTDPQFNFKLETNFLEVLYIDCLPKTLTNGISKVIIEACKQEPVKKMEMMLDVVRLNRVFDFTSYFAAVKESRKRLALEFLQGGLLEIASLRGWNSTSFYEAYKNVLDKKFVNYRPWSKPVTSQSRKYKAQIWCDYDSDKANIFIVFISRKQVVARLLITTVKPGDVWIRDVVGKLEWTSENKVSLTSRNRQESWNATLDLEGGNESQ